MTDESDAERLRTRLVDQSVIDGRRRYEREHVAREIADLLDELAPDFIYAYDYPNGAPMGSYLRLEGADVGETITFRLQNFLDLLKEIRYVDTNERTR